MTPNSRQSPVTTRVNERLAQLVRQKRAPNIQRVGVLSVAIVLGLLGFALHVLWVVAVIVVAPGIRFAGANSGRPASMRNSSPTSSRCQPNLRGLPPRVTDGPS